jgi:hypothetical protein
MQKEVVKVLKPFLQFQKKNYVDQVHNMLAIMLDPQFKSLQIMENLVGSGDAI